MEGSDGIIEVGIFFKAGFDGECMGACYQSQRVLMLAELKLYYGVMNKFKTVPVNISKPPKEFKELGLHLRVPALFFNLKAMKDSEPIDIADDIILELEKLYPGGLLKSDLENESEYATRDFFSKFCHWMRGVVKDSLNLEAELVRINNYLASVIERSPTCDKLFLCGSEPSHIDCEVLPKLHQVRVAAKGIKGYEIPCHLTSLWRYLHTAYNEPAFTKHCPSDTEILLHWLDSGSAKLSPRQQQLLAASKGKPPTYSFSVPAVATRITIE